MWKIKKFKTREAMDAWLVRNRYRIQYEELFVDNAYAIEYRKLRRIG